MLNIHIDETFFIEYNGLLHKIYNRDEQLLVDINIKNNWIKVYYELDTGNDLIERSKLISLDTVDITIEGFNNDLVIVDGLEVINVNNMIYDLVSELEEIEMIKNTEEKDYYNEMRSVWYE
jgi:hypothetical protein